MVASMSVIILVSILTLFLSHKKRNYIYIVLSGVLGLINAMNYLYYKHYHSFLSFSLVKQFKQLKELKGTMASTLDLVVIVFIIPTVLLWLGIKKLEKEDFFRNVKDSKNKVELFRPLVIGLISISVVASTLTSTDISRLIKQWNRPYLVEQLGIYSYTIADFIKNSATSGKVSAVSNDEVENILENLVKENLSKRKENQYTDIFKGKDIYVIHYESAQRFAMNQEFPGGYVTPFLDKMAEEGLFFDNFYPQHSVGTSSDSEFTFNTSLLPINDGTVFITHSDREYLTLQKLLKTEGYYTMSMHGNNGDFWNRNMMHRTLGYDQFFSRQDYIIDEEIGLGLSDMSFFKQSVEKIKEVKEEQESPIMAKLITLTNHYPFDDVEQYGEFDVGHLEGTDIGNYLKSYHYADRALESFIEEMDNEGLLDNAIIVLYGDHHAKISQSDYIKFYNYNEETEDYYSSEDPEYISMTPTFKKQLRRTPFIIWSKDQLVNETIHTPMGMLDALPTLANMTGIFNPFQLGVDIMDVDDNTVVFSDGDWLNHEVYYSASTTSYYDFNNELLEKTPALENINEKANGRIEISNNIIHNNLIKLFRGIIAKKPTMNNIMKDWIS